MTRLSKMPATRAWVEQQDSKQQGICINSLLNSKHCIRRLNEKSSKTDEFIQNLAMKIVAKGHKITS